MKLTIRDMTSASIFAALTAVLSQIIITIPFSPVPFTLQTFSVFLSAVVLGSKRSFLSQIIYIILGLVGLPVFAGFESGLGTIIGPKGGYIISFPLMTLLICYIIDKFKIDSIKGIFLAQLSGLVLCYAIGSAWLGVTMKLTLVQAIIMGTGIFVIFDIIKAIAAAVIGQKLRKILAKTNLA